MEITNSNGCSKLSSGAIVTVPCKEGENMSLADQMDFTVYPNPSTGTFTINLSHTPNHPVQIEMVDAIGKTISKFETTEKTVIVDKSNLAKGIYCLTIRNEDHVAVKKINIVR